MGMPEDPRWKAGARRSVHGERPRGPRSGEFWTEDDLSQALTMAEAGHSATDIGVALGRSPRAIVRKVQRYKPRLARRLEQTLPNNPD